MSHADYLSYMNSSGTQLTVADVNAMPWYEQRETLANSWGVVAVRVEQEGSDYRFTKNGVSVLANLADNDYDPELEGWTE